MISGYLDGFCGREVLGWARADGGEGAASVEITIDGVCVGRVPANQYRADLFDLGVNEGLAGFSLRIPDRFCDGAPHVVEARVAGEPLPLAQSPQVYTFGRELREKQRWCARTIALNAVDRTALAASLAKSRRLAVLATYHRHCEHLGYHRRLVTSLREAGFTVLIVHATDDPAGRLISIQADDCFTLVRRNIGYDFGSYATGLLMFSDLLPAVEELLLINDSVVQVAADLHPLLQRFRRADADVVSCTDSFEIQHHLQSYCLWFGLEAVRSPALISFMANYSFTSVKDEVIEEGEVGLSKALRRDGLRLRSLYEYSTVAARWLEDYAQNVRDILDLPGGIVEGGKSVFKSRSLERLDGIAYNVLSGIPTNPSHFFWDTLIDWFDFPFIKRELIVVNPGSVPTYWKIGSYLPDEVRAVVSEMICVYGGNLVPALVAAPGGESAARLASSALPHVAEDIKTVAASVRRREPRALAVSKG